MGNQGRSPCCETTCYAVDSRDDPKIGVLYAVQQAQGLLDEGLAGALYRAHWGREGLVISGGGEYLT